MQITLREIGMERGLAGIEEESHRGSGGRIIMTQVVTIGDTGTGTGKGGVTLR